MITNRDNIESLSSFPLLEGINRDVITEVEKRCDKLRFKRREVIYGQNENEAHFYFLMEGEVKLSRFLEDGKEIAYRFALPGEVFGELVLNEPSDQGDFAQALTSHITVLRIHKNELLHLLSPESKWEKNLNNLFIQRLHASRNRHEELVQYNSKERIHRFLIQLIETKGGKVGVEDLADFPFTHYDVAAFTQTSRQTVTSLLGDFRRENHIHLERGRLLVRDLKSFKSLKF